MHGTTASTPSIKNLNRPQDDDDRLRRILARMTLARRIGQLKEVSISDPDLIDLIKTGRVGSVILAGDAYASVNKQPGARAESINHL